MLKKDIPPKKNTLKYLFLSTAVITMSKQTTGQVKKDYVLFVHSKCKGSRQALELLNKSGVDNEFEVQNVANIPARMLPEYVTGVPVVVDLRAREVHKGTGCINFVKNKIDNGFVSFMASDKLGFTSFDGNSRTGGKGFTSVDVSQQLEKSNYEEEAATMDVSNYQKMRAKLLPKQQAPPPSATR